MNLTPTERAELAKLAGVGDAYLYQCLTGRKDMKPKEAVRVEEATGGTLRRWHLRPNDWREVWPELRDHPEAPAAAQPTPEPTQQEA